MNSLQRSLTHTVRYLGFLVRQLAGANADLYQRYYSSSRYSALKLSRVLAGLFEPEGHVVFPTQRTVAFGAVPFGADEAGIRALQGEPDCVRRDADAACGFRTLFYKEDVGGYRTRESVGLLDGRMFYGCHNFSRGPLLSRNDVRTIRRSLAGKYLTDAEALRAAALQRFRIVDRTGNLVAFNNGVNLTISYYSGDAALKERLRSLYDAYVEESRNMLRLKREALAGRL